MDDYSELKLLAEHHINLHGDAWHVEESKALESLPTFSSEWFVAAASPKAVLALIAESERLACRLEVSEDTRQVIRKCLATAEGEIDQLKAEVEALRKDAARYRWLRDKQTFIWLIQDWFPGEAMLTNVDADIDAAMSKEAGHD